MPVTAGGIGESITCEVTNTERLNNVLNLALERSSDVILAQRKELERLTSRVTNAEKNLQTANIQVRQLMQERHHFEREAFHAGEEVEALVELLKEAHTYVGDFIVSAKVRTKLDALEGARKNGHYASDSDAQGASTPDGPTGRCDRDAAEGSDSVSQGTTALRCACALD